MATVSAPAAARPAKRQLWQLPAFALGVVAALAVTLGRPLWHPDGPAAAPSQLSQARQLLRGPKPDPDAALAAASNALANAATQPALAGEAHFLLGSAYLLQADRDGGARAAALRKQALQHLDLAQQNGIPDADKPALQLRRAKALFLAGSSDPRELVALLAANAATADDPTEAFGMLAQAYLKIQPPDLPAALEATKQQIDRAPPTANAATLAAARLRRGDLTLQLGQPREARQHLQRIGPDAPLEISQAARMLLARSYEATEEWGPAADLWEQARALHKLPPTERAMAAYKHGLCLLRADRAKDAAAAFADATAGAGPERQAAHLRLAELRLRDEPRAPALESLAAGLDGVDKPEAFNNPLISLAEVLATADAAGKLFVARGEWENAERLLPLLARVAPAGKAADLAAAVADARGDDFTRQAAQSPALAAQLTGEAQKQYKAAATAFLAAATASPPGTDRADRLYRGADRFLKARDLNAALDLLEQFTQMEAQLPPERVAAAWFLTGKIHQSLGQNAAARVAYGRCTAAPGSPHGLSARVLVARMDVAEAVLEDAQKGAPDLPAEKRAEVVRSAAAKFDAAEQALQSALTDARGVPQPDAALTEEATFLLAELAYQRQDYALAEQRLEGAVGQYPASPAANRARLMLGRCHWLKASVISRRLAPAAGATLADDERRRLEKEFEAIALKGIEQYDKIEEALLARPPAALSPEEAVLLRSAAYYAADFHIFIPRYEEAVRRYGALALRYEGTPYELMALYQILVCYKRGREYPPEQAAAALERLKAAFEKMPPAAFDGSTAIHNREYWMTQVRTLAK